MKASLQAEGPNPALVAPGHGQGISSPTAMRVMLVVKSHVSESTWVYEAAQHTGNGGFFPLPNCLK